MSLLSHTPLIINSRTINFFVFTEVPNPRSKITRLRPFFSRMPDQHLEKVALTPYFVVNKLPGGRATGGGYFGDRAVWENKEDRTNVSNDELRRSSRPSIPIVGITKVAFLKDIYNFTIMHETAHVVDQHFRLYPPGATVSTFQGVRYHKNRVGEFAAEAYARYLINPNRVCRDDELRSGENMHTCSQRLIAVLKRSEGGRDL